MAKKDINFNTYVERDLTKSTVNWGAVSNKLTTDLLKIREDREAERAQEDETTADTTRKLNEMEAYTNPTLQNLALGMSGDSAEFLRVQNDLFKRGLITQTQFAQARQRVLGDWQQFGNITKRWESDYASMRGRIDSGEGGSFEAILNQQNAAFGNLKDVTGYVNPETGTLSLVRRNADGSFPTDPSKHVSMNVINNRFSNQINNLNYQGSFDKQLKAKVDTLGKLVIAKVTSDGGIFSEEGQKQALENEEMQNYLNQTARGFTENTNAIFSLLGDVDGNYNLVFTEAEAKEDKLNVLVEFDADGRAVPVTDAPNWGDQVKVAQKIVKDRMIMMLSEVQAVKAGKDKGLTEFEKLKANIMRENKGITDDEAAKIAAEDYNAGQYRKNVTGRAVAEGNKTGGDRPIDYAVDKLGPNIDFTNNDSTVRKTFDNVIQSVMDDDMFEDLENGMYGDEQKPYELVFVDKGADRMVASMGDKVIGYPPLISELPAVGASEFESMNLADNITFDNSFGGQLLAKNRNKNEDNVTYTKEEFFKDYLEDGYGSMPEGYYGLDTDGDGKIDTFKRGLPDDDANKEGYGLNTDYYDKTAEIFDYYERYLMDPVANTLSEMYIDNAPEEVKKYNNKSKSNKKKTPIS